MRTDASRPRPLVAVLCHGATACERRSQYATESFIAAVVAAGGSTILVPALADAVDAATIAARCDALLLTGSSSMVSPGRYSADHDEPEADLQRDAVAFDLAAAMIARRRPVLGICLGMQELNVLHGGSLRRLGSHGLHMRDADWRDVEIFAHGHDVDITCEELAAHGGRRQRVVSAHRQGVARLGSGLRVTATAADGLVEAFAADPEGRTAGVQWHPERLAARVDHALFARMVALA